MAKTKAANEEVEKQAEVKETEEVKPAAKASKAADEIIFVAPHDVYRVAQQGKVIEADEDKLHLILEGEDGKKYAIPYVHQAHKDLKAGDKLKF